MKKKEKEDTKKNQKEEKNKKREEEKIKKEEDMNNQDEKEQDVEAMIKYTESRVAGDANERAQTGRGHWRASSPHPASQGEEK